MYVSGYIKQIKINQTDCILSFDSQKQRDSIPMSVMVYIIENVNVNLFAICFYPIRCD